MEVLKEYKDLVKKARAASTAYYDNDDPIMSDYEFDTIMQRLKAFEAANPALADPESPTHYVGGSAGKSTFQKVQHAVPMLSLQDVFSKDEVLAFMKDVLEKYPRTEFSVEEKIDGLSMSVSYENGKLVRAETRGDGYIGEDITENAKCINGIPLKIENKDVATLEVRCEVYLPVERFLKINQELADQGKKQFANPRNAAAGLLRTKDLATVKKAGLCAFAFDVQRLSGGDELTELMNSQANRLMFLDTLGFTSVRAATLPDGDVPKWIDNIGSYKSDLAYWIDGAVIKVDDIDVRRKLGETNKYPRWAVAYKYPPEEKETVVREIVLQTGRTGRVTPVAVFDPVFLAGTKVERATLHNPEFIEKLGLDVGDTVLVRKAAEIIPEILRVTKKCSEGVYDIFQHFCPSCGGMIVPGADENGDNQSGAYCGNPDCPAQFARRVEFWCSRDCMDIRGLGPAIIDQLIEAELICSIPDIYRLQDHSLVLESMLGEKTTANLLTSIERSKSQDIDRLIKAFGIPGVGRHIGKALAKLYPDILTIGEIPLYPEGYEEKVAQLAEIDGVGDISARAIVDFFKGHKNWKMIYALKELGVNMTSHDFNTPTMEDIANSVFVGKTFVITGTLPSMTREEATKFIEEHGGTVSGSVSKKTSYLLCGDAAGSKLDKAKALGITIINEEELTAMVP